MEGAQITFKGFVHGDLRVNLGSPRNCETKGLDFIGSLVQKWESTAEPQGTRRLRLLVYGGSKRRKAQLPVHFRKEIEEARCRQFVAGGLGGRPAFKRNHNKGGLVLKENEA